MATQRWALFVIFTLGLYGLYSVSLLDPPRAKQLPEPLDLEERLEADAEGQGELQISGQPELPKESPNEGPQQQKQEEEEEEEEQKEGRQVQDEPTQRDEPQEPLPLAPTEAACVGPTLPPVLPAPEATALKSKIWRATQEWGYDQQAFSYRPFKGLNLLDIGMGQGPMGVVAMHVGVKSYKGMDPALCINRHARTRDKRVGRAPNPVECEMLRDSAACHNKGEACEMFQLCKAQMSRKYRDFPFTGLEMMQAYSGAWDLILSTSW